MPGAGPEVTVPDVSPDLPPRGWRVALALLARLPQGAMSRAFGRLADVPIPRPLRTTILGGFARSVGVELAEAERPLEAYRTLNEFFVRRLRPGARRWPEDPDVLASPVDGVLGRFGTITGGRLIQAKGRWYDAGALLADRDEAERYDGGAFVTVYLSPRHYHRIHTPGPGRVVKATHVPGALLPVNAAAVAHVPDLFVRNERLICYVDGQLGRVAVVAVGAYNVGRISAAFDTGWRPPPGQSARVTNRADARPETRSYEPPIELEAGQEIMAFHLGSTVVLLCEPGRVRLAQESEPGTEVAVGQVLGRANTERS